MNKWFKIIGTAVVVGVITVAAFGAVASAQSPTPTTPTTSSTQPNQQPGWGMFGFGHGFKFFGHGGQGSLITAFARALGTTETDLVTELRAGKTLNELAQAKNVNTATVISDWLKTYQDALTTAVTNTQLTQAQADAILALKKANAEAALNFKYDPSRVPQRGVGGFGGFGGMRGGPRRGGLHGWWGLPNQQQAPSGTQPSN